MIIYLDFDGTVVEHQFPIIGRCNFGCIEVIEKLQQAGHQIILNTLRVEHNQETFQAAVRWFDHAYMFLKDRKRAHERDLTLQPITHSPHKIDPGRWDWDEFMRTQVIMIDDNTRGIPLKNAMWSPSKMVDWDKVDEEFTKRGIYNK